MASKRQESVDVEQNDLKETNLGFKDKQSFDGSGLASVVDEVKPPTATESRTGLRKLFLTVILLFYFLSAFDSTLIANLRPPIIKDFGHVERLPLMSTAYSMGSVSGNLAWYVCQSRSAKEAQY